MGFGADIARRARGRSGDLHGFGNGLRQVQGQGKGLVEVAIVTLGPDVRVGGSVDELHGHVHAFGGALDGAFEDAVDAQLASDVGKRTLYAFVLHGGGAGDDAERGVLSQHGDDFVGHAIGEVVLRRVTGEIRQRNHGDGMDLPGAGRGEEAVAKAGGIDGDQGSGHKNKEQGGGALEPVLRGSEGDGGGSGDRFGGRNRSGGCWSGFGRSGRGEGGDVGLFGDEAVSLAGDGLDEARVVGIVAQGLADLADGSVDAVFGVDENIFAPEAVDDFLAGDDGTLLFGEQQKEFERDAFELQSAAVAPQLEAVTVELEFTEMVGAVGH